MMAQGTLPSPLAGERAERRRREAGEGASQRTGLARGLRSRMTDAERKLWLALRGRRFAACKFRRQVPVGAYVADFICFEARLVIEVDGGQHAESSHDQARDEWFVQNNFRVMRFWNNDVLSNLEAVLTVLAKELTPHPPSLRSGTLSRKGRGKKEVAR